MNGGGGSETVYGECDHCGAYRDLRVINGVFGKAYLCLDCMNDLKERGEIL